MYYKVFKKFLVLSIYAQYQNQNQNKAAKREARSAKPLSAKRQKFIFFIFYRIFPFLRLKTDLE